MKIGILYMIGKDQPELIYWDHKIVFEAELQGWRSEGDLRMCLAIKGPLRYCVDEFATLEGLRKDTGDASRSLSNR